MFNSKKSNQMLVKKHRILVRCGKHQINYFQDAGCPMCKNRNFKKRPFIFTNVIKTSLPDDF